MLTITGLTKRFGRLDVLRGVDLALRPGAVTAVLGPNGAGKTTLIKSVLGLTRPDAGRILLDGERVGADPRDPAYRARIGYMPQIARFPENLTAAELFRLLVELRTAPGGAASPDAVAPDEALVERFGLGPHLGKPLRTLSGGTRQKVNAVAAFLFRPSLLILDEPTAGLDPVSSGVLKDRILEARQQGTTFLLTSHIVAELEELADDVVFLLEGRVAYAGSVHDLKLATRQLNLERAIASMMLEAAA